MSDILKSLEVADTGTLEVMDNTGMQPLVVNGVPVTIEGFGPGSEQYAKAQAMIDSAAQARTFAALRGKASKDNGAEARNLQARKLAMCTHRINGLGEINPLDVYTNPKLGYITNQFAKYIEDWGNFSPVSSKS